LIFSRIDDARFFRFFLFDVAMPLFVCFAKDACLFFFFYR